MSLLQSPSRDSYWQSPLEVPPQELFHRNRASPRLKRAPTTRIAALFFSLLLTAALLTFGVIFLAFPITARNLLYPCLSRVEDESTNDDANIIVESDTVRIAGACLISVAISSLGLLLPLLPCCPSGKLGDGKSSLTDYFFLRTLFFLHGAMGLSLIVIGLINLDDAEFSHFYGKTHSAHCSSVKDQVILWMGVGILCLTSFGLMCTFLPARSRNERGNQNTRGSWCCCRRPTTSVPRHIDTDALEPLLHQYEDGMRVNDENSILSDSLYRSPANNDDENNSGSSSSDSDTETTIPTVVGADDETRSQVQIDGNNRKKTSRLRGTSRLLKLAGKESLYLWLGIVVLLIRLPFSLSIPHFVSTTIGSLIDEDYDGAKRNVLLLFLAGSVDSILDFWVLFLFGYAKENIVKGVRMDTFASIMRQEQAFFDKTTTGELMSRLSSDCGEMAG